jgi:hypothetical protein
LVIEIITNIIVVNVTLKTGYHFIIFIFLLFVLFATSAICHTAGDAGQ